ncbi:TrkH family potassium uptake protein [Pseudohalioglobus lutimaris]|uniref:TrkH family potassium uptake protein n=2 Tax=Pseudohalioglobus lutimaris TaxID=1737061 RepID=A0A2N5X851_9GAMM|nr:TrkH family potassium uptake protein [Pseudohalioglobus lutimaris]
MHFAVRPGVIMRLLSDMYGVVAVLTAIPTVFALACNSEALTGYLVVLGLLGVVWAAGRLFPRPVRVQKNESLSMVALLFISVSLLYSIPIMAYGIPFADAWFEAVSGVTTTGLSTLELDQPSPAFLFARGWMQWVGGLGVVVLALALFIAPGQTARSLGFSNQEMDDVVGGTRAHARRVTVVYVLITAVGVLALLLTGSAPLDAVVHTMAAISTGGFANYGDSLASLPSVQIWTINMLCIAGAVSFHVYYRSLLLSGRGGFADNQLYSLLLAIGLACMVGFGLVWQGGLDIGFTELATLVVSAQTTAGFSAGDISVLSPSLLLLLVVCMAIGGGVGSTSGGIKLGRVQVMFRLARSTLGRTGLSDHVFTGEGKNGGAGREQEALALLLLFLFSISLSWLVFLSYGYPVMPSLFEVVSAATTSGLSSGLTQAGMPLALKVLLCCLMLLGRLEFIALLVLLSPRSWLGRRRRIRRE